MLAVLPQALTELGLALEDFAERDKFCPSTFLASKNITPFSWGEKIRISVASIPPQATELRVLTRRVVATNLTARGDWSEHIHRAVLAALEEQRS